MGQFKMFIQTVPLLTALYLNFEIAKTFKDFGKMVYLEKF